MLFPVAPDALIPRWQLKDQNSCQERAKNRQTRIELIPPKPTSPKELGLSGDRRKLGIGFINMKIIPIEGDKK